MASSRIKHLAGTGWKWMLTIVFGICVFVFWRFRYPYALAFQEQLQLFLFDGSYLSSRLGEPGGVARYVAEFLVQLYNNFYAGALVLAVLYMLIQRLVWRLMQPCQDVWYALSFVPSVMLWFFMGDENVMLTAPVSLTMGLAAMLCWPKDGKAQWAYIFLGLPLIYWMIGPLVLMVAAYVLLAVKWDFWGISKGILALVLAFACIAVSAWLLPYPFIRLMFGLDYYRHVEVVSYMFVAIVAVCLLLACVPKKLPDFRLRGSKPFAASLLAAVIAVLAASVVPMGYEQRKYDLLEYDFLVRTNQWNAIIAKSQKRQPDLPMSVCANNLALGMTGQLGERAFEFYQNGVDGLLPNFESNYATIQLTGEAYFQLGLVNTAQRYAFEAMEAIPNYNKSARSLKRLAETNLINGQYEVSRKYLNILKKTLFYRNWATRTEALLGNEKAINQHPIYGRMRGLRLEEDLLFSENEIDKICGQLFLRNNQNKLAMEYLLMCPLLERNIDKFLQYAGAVQEKVLYNPTSCQEALAYAFARKNQQPPQGLVSPVIMSRMADFVGTMKTAGASSPQLEIFRNTVWYYLMVGGEK